MADIVVAHTGQLDSETREAARALLDDVFAPNMRDSDWEHCLGGMHALLWEGPELVGHAALVQRRMLHNGRTFRTGYVEGVAVRADVRRRGHASVMLAALEALARGAYELAALSSTAAGAALYAGRGWLVWQGITSGLTSAGVVRTAGDDGSVFVFPIAAELDLHGELTCDWRSGDLW